MNTEVEMYYDQMSQEEDKRLDKHVFELPFTLQYIEKYLNKGSKILDIACGTGRYAEKLLEKGYYVGLGDISEKNIELTRKRVGYDKHILGIEKADALDSDLWYQEDWDAILLLGPLYHLISRHMRLRIMHKAYDYVNPGGYVFTAFMNRTLALIYGMKNNPTAISDEHEVERLWKSGNDEHFVEGTPWFSHAYFAFPEEINPLLKDCNLKPLHLIGLEGIFGERFENFHLMDSEIQKKWMDFTFKHCEDPHLIEHSKHLLSISRK